MYRSNGSLLLVLCVSLALGCARAEPDDTVRELPRADAFQLTPPGRVDPPAAGWRPIAEMEEVDYDDRLTLWLRFPLAELPAPRTSLVFRAYLPAFAIFLDQREIYRWNDRSFDPDRLSYHVVAFPEMATGSIHLWYPRARALRFSFSSSALLTHSSRAMKTLQGYMLAPLRSELPDLVMAIVLFAAGLLATALAPSMVRQNRALVFAFGAFSLLYGVRVLVSSHLALMLGIGLLESIWITALITYVINIPAWGFTVLLLGPGWRRLLERFFLFTIAFAPIAVFSDFLRDQPFSFGQANNLLALTGVAITVFHLWYRRARGGGEVVLLICGFTILAVFAVATNLVGLGILPRMPLTETIGFFFFTFFLGVATIRRVLERDRKLVTLQGELETARAIQRSILPRQEPLVAGLEIAARHRPMSGVAGDLYDFRQLDDGRLVTLVADVSGHGIPAALVASMVTTAFATQRPADGDPAKALETIAGTVRPRLGRGFVTALCATIDPSGKTITLASAGHPYPFVWRYSTGILEEIEVRGSVIGRLPFGEPQTTRIAFDPGDRFILFTDGLLETRDPSGNEIGDRALSHLVSSGRDLGIEQICDNLLAGLDDYRGSQEPEDDLTLVVIECTTQRPSSLSLGGRIPAP